MKKGFAPIILLFVAVAIVIAGAGIWFTAHRGNFPLNHPVNPGKIACTQEAKLCPDGSYVGRTSPNCEFAACPTPAAVTTSTVTNVSNWKTYTNQQYGFSLKYPPQWLFQNDDYRAHDFSLGPRSLFQLWLYGPKQSGPGGGFDDGANVRVEITETSTLLRNQVFSSGVLAIATSTPDQWVSSTIFRLYGTEINQIVTNGFVGMTKIERSNSRRVSAETGAVYQVLPDNRALLVSWERMNLDLANDFDYQSYFLPILSTFQFIQPISGSGTNHSAGTAPSIFSLDPSSGSIGTKVTITGSNFLPVENNIYFDSKIRYFNYVSSTNNGKVLTFTLPAYGSPLLCELCEGVPVAIGVHQISVRNANGVSNNMSFMVTSD